MRIHTHYMELSQPWIKPTLQFFLMILQKEIQGDDDSEMTKRNKDQIEERDSTDLL